MVRVLLGFVAGVLYGVIITVEVPDGMIAKVASLLKMLVFG